MIPLLMQSLPAKTILRFLKEHPQLAQTVFHGFTPREKTLALPVVAQRVVAELARQPQLLDELQDCWRQAFPELIDRVRDVSFSPNSDELAEMTRRHGDAALRYALTSDQRPDIQALADTIPAAKRTAAAPEPQPAAPPVGQKHANLLTHQENAPQPDVMHALRQTNSRLEKLLTERESELAGMHKQLTAALERLEREQRRVKKAENEVAELRKTLKQMETAPAPTTEPDNAASLREAVATAIDLLQRGLDPQHGMPAIPLPAHPAASQPPLPAVSPHADRTHSRSTISLPLRQGKRTYHFANLLNGLRQNDTALLDEIRDGIARLAETPARERAAVAELTKAGVPDALLRGPLRPAVIDGSNVANVNADSGPARLVYLQQVQQSAWREGYFPVYIIVDASLRHSIDRADLLMDMVERGSITMAPAGTSADELLIDEARHRRAVIITNDRMSEWPAARDLEKRHVLMSGGNAGVGDFHRGNVPWFY